MAEVKQIKTTDGTYDIDAKYWNGQTTLKTINGNTLFGGGDIPAGNITAVDTGDVLDDVNTNYATVAYVDGLVGDINSVLESIING